jgi:hypothetical protein
MERRELAHRRQESRGRRALAFEKGAEIGVRYECGRHHPRHRRWFNGLKVLCVMDERNEAEQFGRGTGEVTPRARDRTAPRAINEVVVASQGH